MQATVHPRQPERLAALRRYDILDTPKERDFDEIVELVSTICETPISVVNLIDADRQWFKAEVGLGVRETPLATSLCAHAILEQDFLEIPDTLADDRMCDNPLCLGEEGLRFYAGALLRTEEGLPIGTLCVLDTKPRRLSPTQLQTLKVLARQVMTQLELRLALARQRLLVKESDHRVKNSLQSTISMLQLKAMGAKQSELREAFEDAATRVQNVALLHQQLYVGDAGEKIDLDAYLRGLAQALRANAPYGVRVDFDGSPMALESQRAAALGIIVCEFVSNAIKHATVNGRCAIRISLRRDGAARAVLRCQDDGPGLQNDGVRDGGIGMRIMAASANQMGGHFSVLGDRPGVGIEIEFELQTDS